MAVSSRAFRSQTVRRLQAAYQRLAEQVRQRYRSLGRLVSWSAQVLLYPIYLGFQSTRLIYRQLQAASPNLRQPGPSGAASEADEMITDCLAVLAGTATLPQGSTPLTIQLAQQLREVRRLPLQSIACDLLTGSPMIVLADGQPLTLTPTQQQLVHLLISQLLSDYELSQRQLRRLLEFRHQPLPPPQPGLLVWQPIARVQRLMAWVQRGDVAATINLFGEIHWLESYPAATGIADIAPLQTASQPPGAATSVSQPAASAPSPQPTIPVEPTALSQRLYAQGRDPQPAARPTVAAEPLTPNSALAPTPWIDTHATLVSYMDHPLVRVLRWIDNGLLWFERRFRQLWRWVRDRT